MKKVNVFSDNKKHGIATISKPQRLDDIRVSRMSENGWDTPGWTMNYKGLDIPFVNARAPMYDVEIKVITKETFKDIRDKLDEKDPIELWVKDGDDVVSIQQYRNLTVLSRLGT